MFFHGATLSFLLVFFRFFSASSPPYHISFKTWRKEESNSVAAELEELPVELVSAGSMSNIFSLFSGIMPHFLNPEMRLTVALISICFVNSKRSCGNVSLGMLSCFLLAPFFHFSKIFRHATFRGGKMPRLVVAVSGWNWKEENKRLYHAFHTLG